MKSSSGNTKKAAALAYKDGDYAPRIIAKGQGVTAEAIISLARENGIYIHESPELVGLLMQVDLDRFIPPELYHAVAELLVWIYWLEHLPEMDPLSIPEVQKRKYE